MRWILPSLGVIVCWGLWGFLPKITIQHIKPTHALIYEVCGGFLVAIGVLLATRERPAFHPVGSALAVTTGMVGLTGALCYLFALRAGKVAVVSTFTAIYPVVTVLLAAVVLGERPSLRQWAGIGLAIVAVLLLAEGGESPADQPAT